MSPPFPPHGIELILFSRLRPRRQNPRRAVFCRTIRTIQKTRRSRRVSSLTGSLSGLYLLKSPLYVFPLSLVTLSNACVQLGADEAAAKDMPTGSPEEDQLAADVDSPMPTSGQMRDVRLPLLYYRLS